MKPNPCYWCGSNDFMIDVYGNGKTNWASLKCEGCIASGPIAEAIEPDDSFEYKPGMTDLEWESLFTQDDTPGEKLAAEEAVKLWNKFKGSIGTVHQGNMKTIESCYFCGYSKLDFFSDYYDNEYSASIQCPRCKATGPTAWDPTRSEAESEAIRLWNTLLSKLISGELRVPEEE